MVGKDYFIKAIHLKEHTIQKGKIALKIKSDIYSVLKENLVTMVHLYDLGNENN